MKRLFCSDIDPPRALSRATASRVGWLFGPAVVFLTLLRLLQHAMLGGAGTPAVGALLVGPAPPLFFILLTTTLLGWGAYRTWPRIRPVWLLGGTLLLGAALMRAAAALVPPWLSGWITVEAFQVLRWDLLAMLVLAVGSAVLLERLRGTARALCLAALHTLIPVLLWLPIFELSVIRAMGTPLDWSLLSYSIRHLGELAPVIASEAGPAEVGLLALPLVLTLWPLAKGRLPATRRRAEAPPSDLPTQPWRAGGVALPLAILLAAPPATPLPPTHQTISYPGMVRSMLEDGSDGLDGLSLPVAPPFDTRTLRFVPTDRTRRLNVVVLLLESFRSRSVTPYAPDLVTTPFLDRLAQRALLVDNMYAVVSYTNKALAPILAGVYPELSRENVEAEPDALPAAGLPRLLKPHGYRTAFFTPARMSFERKDQILKNLGFDEYYGDAAYPKEGFHVTNYFGYEDRVMLEPSLAWVDATTARGQPFFLSYLTLTAHHDYLTPPTFAKQPFAPYDPRLNDYLNALRYTDAFLQDLFDAFEARGLLESTLFILLGDHGEAFGEHGQMMHGDVIWDEAIHTPALLYNPVLFPEGGRIPGNRSHVDVLPTVADALGYRIEGGAYPGLSLLRPVPDGRIVYHSARNGNLALALRQDSLKFFYYNRRQPMQVFDVRNDPLERRDIAGRIAPDRLKSVELKLLLWRRGVQQIYHDHGQTDRVATASFPSE